MLTVRVRVSLGIGLVLGSGFRSMLLIDSQEEKCL